MPSIKYGISADISEKSCCIIIDIEYGVNFDDLRFFETQKYCLELIYNRLKAVYIPEIKTKANSMRESSLGDMKF